MWSAYSRLLLAAKKNRSQGMTRSLECIEQRFFLSFELWQRENAKPYKRDKTYKRDTSPVYKPVYVIIQCPICCLILVGSHIQYIQYICIIVYIYLYSKIVFSLFLRQLSIEILVRYWIFLVFYWTWNVVMMIYVAGRWSSGKLFVVY